MKGTVEFFKTQMKSTIAPAAKKRLELEIMPKLCVNYDVCPACGGDLELANDVRSAYRWSLKICVKCGNKYENNAVKRRKDGQQRHNEPKTIF